MKRYWIIPIVAVLFVAAGCGASSPGGERLSTKDRVEQENIRTVAQTPDLQGGPENNVREPQPVSLADLQKKYRSTFVLSGPPTKRAVALTFDDAPDAEFTPQVLDALKKAGVKATFFVVGNRVEAHPDVMRRIVWEGHAIGNHSYNHANLPKLSDKNFRDQVERTDHIIQRYTNEIPRIFRPPYGNISEDQIKWLASQGKKVVNWNVDSLDWKGLSAEQVRTNVLSNVQPGAIILQHSGGGKNEDLSGTVEAIPSIVKKLKGDKVKLVTIPELLDTSLQVDSRKER